MSERGKLIAISVVISLATVASYWGVWGHRFLLLDDPLYVTQQPMVQKGLTAQGIWWAFTTKAASNYHPITWLSHMLDCSLFGMSAAGPHSVNLAIHIANAIILLLVFWRMTAALRLSAFVAAVFALHPLHVESVAWASERKDVLSAFFFFLTLIIYGKLQRSKLPSSCQTPWLIVIKQK